MYAYVIFCTAQPYLVLSLKYHILMQKNVSEIFYTEQCITCVYVGAQTEVYSKPHRRSQGMLNNLVIVTTLSPFMKHF